MACLEISICGALLRPAPSDVHSVRLRSARLAAHPHLKHFSMPLSTRSRGASVYLRRCSPAAKKHQASVVFHVELFLPPSFLCSWPVFASSVCTVLVNILTISHRTLAQTRPGRAHIRLTGRVPKRAYESRVRKSSCGHFLSSSDPTTFNPSLLWHNTA